MLRDGTTGDWIGTFLGHKGAVWQARLSLDATLAATASADFSAKVWDPQTGESVHTLQHDHIVRAVAFPNQPNPKILATGGMEKKLRIFDLSRGSSSVQVNGTSQASAPPSFEIGPGVHERTIKSIVWAVENPNVLITAAEDMKIRWWDLRSRSTIGQYTVDGPVGTCEMDNTSVEGSLSIAAGKSVYFFSGTHPATLMKSMKTPYEIASVALHSTERKFVTGGGNDTWVRVWDFDEERELGMAHSLLPGLVDG